MSKQGMGQNTDLVYEYFVSTVDAMTLKLGFSPIRWEEVRAALINMISTRGSRSKALRPPSCALACT
jgi:hypothetical protein